MKKFTKFLFTVLLLIPGLIGAQMPFAKFSASDTALCVPASVNFSDLSTGNPGSWKWFFQGGSPDTSTLQNPPPITYHSPGDYTVKLVVANGSGIDSNKKTNYIHAYSPPNVVFTGPDTLCQYTSATITASGGTRYLWASGATTSTVNITAIVSFEYTVTVYNGTCFKDTGFFIHVDTCLGIPLISELPKISIYPNPTTSLLNITIDKPVSENSLLSVIDITGRELISQKISPSQSQITINVSILAPSIYFLKIQTDQGIVVKKFMKE